MFKKQIEKTFVLKRAHISTRTTTRVLVLFVGGVGQSPSKKPKAATVQIRSDKIWQDRCSLIKYTSKSTESDY